jgi:hypothetical protein
MQIACQVFSSLNENADHLFSTFLANRRLFQEFAPFLFTDSWKKETPLKIGFE